MRTIIKAGLLITLTVAIFLPCSAFMNKVEDDQPPRLALEIQLLVDQAKALLEYCR